MKTFFIFGAGVTLGALGAWWLVSPPSTNSRCCARVAAAARDEIASQTGGGAALATALDWLGITGHLPTILDKAGL